MLKFSIISSYIMWKESVQCGGFVKFYFYVFVFLYILHIFLYFQVFINNNRRCYNYGLSYHKLGTIIHNITKVYFYIYALTEFQNVASLLLVWLRTRFQLLHWRTRLRWSRLVARVMPNSQSNSSICIVTIDSLYQTSKTYHVH